MNYEKINFEKLAFTDFSRINSEEIIDLDIMNDNKENEKYYAIKKYLDQCYKVIIDAVFENISENYKLNKELNIFKNLQENYKVEKFNSQKPKENNINSRQLGIQCNNH